MSEPILVTGAAGGEQGSTGRHIAGALIARGFRVRAFVHRLDARSDRLRALGAEVVEGDLLNPESVRRAMTDVKRAYFTYPVAEGLLEATTSFAVAARAARTEMVVNCSQLQSTTDVPSFRNLQHRLADQIFDWADVGAIDLQAPPFYENVLKLVANSVAEQDAIYLPWGRGDAFIPLVGAEDVARVATALLMGPTAGRRSAYELIAAVPSVRDIVSSIEKAIKRPIRYVAITDAQWAEAAGSRINAHAVDHLSHLWRYFRDIPDGARRFPINDTIRTLTGTDPQTLDQFFDENVEVLGGLREGAGSGRS